MSESAFIGCAVANDGRHDPVYENGRIKFIPGDELATHCQHCGLIVVRAHRKSPWWWTPREEV